MTITSLSNADQVVSFWCEAGSDKWFQKDAVFDAHFRSTFLTLHMQAAARECDSWKQTATGALALLILLDQFPRNAFRGTAHMYATDALARHFARLALEAGFPEEIESPLRVFFFLPFSHSEDLSDQNLAVELNKPLGDPFLFHALEHRDIISRFGRFPHRNTFLGRSTTDEEAQFLAGGGFAG